MIDLCSMYIRLMLDLYWTYVRLMFRPMFDLCYTYARLTFDLGSPYVPGVDTLVLDNWI